MLRHKEERVFVDQFSILWKKLNPCRSTAEDKAQFVKNSVLYKEFLAEREEILKHKWIESEKAGPRHRL